MKLRKKADVIGNDRLPLPSGFTGYAFRFVDPALGFATGKSFKLIPKLGFW